MNANEKELTGYPSIDKPWLKYYSEEAISAPLPKKTLWQYVYENNKDYPDDIAFRYFGTKITYGEFFENVKRAARSFVAMGIAEDHIVTIMSMHTPEAIYAFYGLNYIGAVANMVYMTLSPKEILHTINDTESKLFLVLDPAIPKVKEIQKDLSIPIIILSVADSMPVHLKMGYRLKNKARLDGALTYHEFLRKGVDTALPAEATSSEKMAVIVYTSGTTGEPKGVMLSDDNMNAHVSQDVNGLFTFERGLSFLFPLPLFLGYGVSHLHTYLCSGLTLVLQIDMSMQAVADSFYKHVPNCIVGAPPLVDYIMQHKGGKHTDLGNLKIFVSGGAEITPDKERAFNDFLKDRNSRARYFCGYGMTEAGSTLCVNAENACKISSSGIPFIKTIVKVIDIDTQREVKYGEVGELHFSTPNLMLGYFHNENASNDVVYVDDSNVRWVKTGDLGYVDEDGFVFVTGRIKRIFFTKDKSGAALKLFPQRIEELLLSDDNVELCGVVVGKDAEHINIAVAFVTLKDKSLSGEQQNAIRTRLFALAEQELPEHEQPVEIHIIDTMPLTPSGKIDYRKLEELQKKVRRGFCHL